MMLRKLRVVGIRGFNHLREFTFALGLNTMYGPNGLGKTSVAEAIEWLFFGETSKLRFARSKIEFRNSLRNLHYVGPGHPYVEAEIVLPSGAQHTIRRELLDDDSWELSIDGAGIANLESLQVFQETSPVPVVAQHALKEFIHNEPAKRWDVISKMLGLEALSGFRAALTTAITQFRNANAQVLGAATELSASLKNKPALQPLAPLARSLETLNSTKFESELNKITTATLGSTPEDALASLLAERQGLTDSLASLPDGITQAAVTAPTNFETARGLVGQVVKIADRFVAVYPEYVAVSEVQVVAERIDLLKKGLALIQDAEPTCPFCGEPTVTPSKRTLLESEVNAHERLHALYSTASSEVRALADHIPKLTKAVEGLVPSAVPEAALHGLAAILPPDLFAELSELAGDIARTEAKLGKLKTGPPAALSAVQDDFKHRRLSQAHLSDLVGQIGEVIQVIESGERIRVKAAELQSKAVPHLQQRAMANERVELVDALIRVWRNRLVVQEACKVQVVVQRMTGFKKNTEEHEKAKTAERLGEKDTEILRWYTILNPNEDVRFARMGLTGTNARHIDLVAELYGKTANAAAMLSEAHINATGLSVYLAQIVTDYSPLRFIFLDDPVQSMDADHTFRLQTELIAELVAKGYQVVLLSHLQTFINDVRLHHGLTLDFDYEFASYGQDGPLLMERGPNLTEYIREADSLRKGGALQRTNALTMLRKAVERMCKLAYTKTTGEPLPAKYESLTSKQIKEMAKGIIPPEDLGKVSLVLKYSDPASHDDVKREPPTDGMVDSMISQVVNLIVKHVDPGFKRP